MIEGTREVIQTLQSQQNDVYQNLVNDLGDELFEENEEWLRDYCFNCGEDSDSDYFKMVKGYIYGNNR